MNCGIPRCDQPASGVLVWGCWECNTLREHYFCDKHSYSYHQKHRDGDLKFYCLGNHENTVEYLLEKL